MTRIKLKHVDCFTDRHGSIRYYFRRGKGARTSLPGMPGSLEFMSSYQALLTGEEAPKAQAKQRGKPGTIDRLIAEYFQSDDFVRLSKASQKEYRSIIERWVVAEKIGDRPVQGMQIEHVKRMIAKRSETPGAANKLLKHINILMRFAVIMRYRNDNPAMYVKKYKLNEWHTWTEQQIELFENHWHTSTKERLAFALLLFTGQRRSDIVKMSWRDIDDGVIQVKQQKTGAKLWIPIHPALKEVLGLTKKEHISILTTNYGKPFSAPGFGNWMADKIAAAGLPDECITHGLRKAAARRLAEAGCSANEIASITGHKSIAEVERYTRAADQKRLAKSAVARLSEHNKNRNSQT